MKINLNQHVRCVLTDYGNVVLRQHCDLIATRVAHMWGDTKGRAPTSREYLPSYLSLFDSAGRLRMQMWQFMSIFGPSLLGPTGVLPVVGCELEIIPDDGPEITVGELTTAARDVLAERAGQVSREGWGPAHDDAHRLGELALAAACYALDGAERTHQVDLFSGIGKRQVRAGWFDIKRLLWPWDWAWFKPKTDRRRNLVIAGALVLAEIERLDRVAAKAAS